MMVLRVAGASILVSELVRPDEIRILTTPEQVAEFVRLATIYDVGKELLRGEELRHPRQR